MYNMPVKNPISHTLSNGYNEKDSCLIPFSEMYNNDATLPRDKTEMTSGVPSDPPRILGVYLAQANNLHDDKTCIKGLKLGAIILGTKKSYTAAELRKHICDQITKRLPHSFDLVTARGWPLHEGQEARVQASQLICENNSICIQRHFDKPYIGVINSSGENLGFVFADYEFSLQKTRQALEDQLRDVLPTKREYRFLESHGWPVKPAQENLLTLLDILVLTASPPHIVIQYGERISAPPPLPPMAKPNLSPHDPITRLPTTNPAGPDVPDGGPQLAERLRFKNLFRDISIKRATKDDHQVSHRELVAKAILISYVRNEAAQHALNLKEELCKMNCSVYLDVDEIKPSIDWQDSLNFAVSNCTVFVPLITPLYGKTQWTNREVKLADVRRKIIIPVNFMDHWPPDCLAIQFASTQYIHWKWPQEGEQPANKDTEQVSSDDWKIWKREHIRRTAKEIAERYLAIERERKEKRERGPRRTARRDKGKDNPNYIEESEAAPSDKSLIVISVHPKQKKIALELSEALKKEGYNIWCSCEPHIFTGVESAPAEGASPPGEDGASPSALPPTSPHDLPPIPEREMFLSQNEPSSSLQESIKRVTILAKESSDIHGSCKQKLTRTVSNMGELHYLSTISPDKISQLRQFQQKVDQAGLIIIITSEAYYKSKCSLQQVFYCEHRKKVVVVEAERSNTPTWFNMLLGQATRLQYSHQHFLPSLLSKIKKSLDPGVTESSTDTVAEAKLQCWVNFMKNSGLIHDLCVYVVGSSKIQSERTEAICRALGEELSKIQNVALVTGGFYGVPELVSQTFIECQKPGSKASLFHVLPHKDTQDYTPKARQNPDGSFEVLPYGKSIFVGDSVKERDMAIARHINTCILIEGGPGAAHEVEEFIWNDHFVIPVYSTGGAAGGNYGMPVKIFEIPPSVVKEDWDLLSDKNATPAQVAKAIVNSLMVIKQSIAAHNNKTQELKAAASVTGRSRRKKIREIGEVATNRDSRILPMTPDEMADTSPVTDPSTPTPTRMLGTHRRRRYGSTAALNGPNNHSWWRNVVNLFKSS